MVEASDDEGANYNPKGISGGPFTLWREYKYFDA